MDISTGSGSAGGGASPLEFLVDGVPTQVSEDTVTPANSVPLPVQLYGVAGQINVTAGDLNVHLSDSGANYDITRIGDGTNELGITGASEAKVSDATAQTSLASLDTKQESGDIRVAYDERVIAYVGATTKIDTITYKLATVTVALQTFSYDGSDRLTGIVTT